MFITFEGIDGSGKTTQVWKVAGKLKAAGRQVVVTREPGGCLISDKIRSLLLDPASKGMGGETELLLFAAARAKHVRDVIRPALDEGKIVLCDRFYDSSMAYQGYGRGIDIGSLLTPLGLSGGANPDLTFLLDLPVEDAMVRSGKRKALGLKETRLDDEEAEFHQRVRDGYYHIWRNDPKRIYLADATCAPDITTEEIYREIVRRLP